MRKTCFFVFLALLSLSPKYALAHTISQHLEEFYSNAYLPLFVIAKLLPFIGLGMLAYNPQKEKQTFQVLWPIILSLITGMILGVIIEGGSFVLILNNLSIGLCGILLLLNLNYYNYYLVGLLSVFGITLGFEHSKYLSQANHLTWFYLLILLIGIAIFIFLNNHQILANPKRIILRNLAGLMLVLAGIISILLT